MKDPAGTNRELREKVSASEQKIKKLKKTGTRRNKKKDGLQKNGDHYSVFFDLAPNPMAISSFDDGRFVDVNQAFVAQSQYSRDELIGRTSTKLGFWVNDEDRGALLNRLRETGFADGVELTFRRKDGEARQVMFFGKVIEVGNQKWLLSVSPDITNHKLIEDALRQREKQYRSIFENAVEGIFQTTPEGKVITANTTFAKMYGYDSPEEIMRSLTDIGKEIYVNYEDRGRFKAMCEEQGLVEGFEEQVYRKDRKKIWVSINARTVRDENGKTLYYEGTIEDITRRKKAEDALRESEALFRSLVENMLDPLVMLSFDGTVLFANPAAVHMLELPPGESTEGQPFTRFLEEESLQKAVADLETIRQGDGPLTGDYCLRTYQGQSRWVEARGIRTIYLGEAVDLVTLRDITERKLFEEALQKSEERYRSLFENAVVGIYRTTIQGRIVSANHAFARMFGYDSPEELMNSITDIGTEIYANPRDRAKVTELCLKHGFVEGIEAQYFRRDKSTGWFSINARAIKDAGGNIVCFEGFVEDITTRKQAEEDLRTTRQRLSDIIEFLPDATFVIDNDKKVVAWNRACEEMTGVKKEEMVGKGDYAYAVPLYGRKRKILIDYVATDPDELLQRYKSIKKRGNLLYIETFAPMLNNGKGVFVSANASPLFDKDGRIMGAIESMRDISDFRRLETQLRQAQKMESIGTLAGGIAHDFNNILTALTGYATLMRIKLEKENPLQPYVDQILSASKKATDLTRSLLTFSRQQPVTLAPLDINDTIKATEKLLKRLLTEDIDVRMSFTPDNTVVMADRSQIDQILFNLVTNARDAMPKGGTLSIETGTADIDDGFVKAHGFGKPGKYVLITVSDTGTGMNKITREKIFDPFFTTKETGHGTGLGLPTVYGIMKQHGGYITVYSEPGHGTTFRIYLLAVNTVAVQETVTTKPARGGNETILIAEDNEGVRHFIQDALRQHGYKTIEAEDGEDAIAKFKQHRNIGLIIIDSVMPKKNGREVYEEVHRINPQIRALFTSGYTKDFVLNKGIEDGKFDFIAKPLIFDTFLEKVRTVLDK